MILQPVLSTLTTIINQLIALDPDTVSRLKQFQGETLKIEFTNIPLTFYVCLDEQRLTLLSETDAPVETTLRGSLWSLSQLAAPAAAHNSKLFSNDVEISGNIEFGQTIKKTFDQLDIDWEEYLAQTFGDVTAHHIGETIRAVNAYGQAITESFTENTRDYVHYELSASPCQDECDAFYADIATLKDDVERLSARIARLLASVDGSKHKGAPL